MNKIVYIFYLFFPYIDSKNKQCIYYRNMIRNDMLRFILSLKYNSGNNIDLYMNVQIKYAEVFNQYYSLSEKDRIVIETIKDLII